jgi:hypothetical protein
MKLSISRVILGLLGIALGVSAVLALREATLSTHHRVARDSQAVIVLDARTKGGETGQTLDEMVEAILLMCRLEVGNSDPVEGFAQDPDDDPDEGRFTAVFQPGLDQTNARQLRGCLEDWTIDHVSIDVVSITDR